MTQAAGTSIDPAAMLRSVGLDPDSPLDVGERITDDAYYDLLERIATRMGSSGVELPLRAGALMRHDDYGALGLAWKSAATTRDSLERVERYARLWTDNMTYELRQHEQGDGADFVLHRFGERRLGMRLSNEATLASATSLIRQRTSTAFRPVAVYCEHRAPRSTTAHERYFGCPVHFGCEDDALRISGADLALPNDLADDGISRFLLAHLEAEIEALDERDPIEDLVRQTVSRSLSAGVPRMRTVARRLAMSERTLQRRLAEQDLTFKDLLAATREQLARNLLEHSSYSLSEIGFLTGFSEQSAFTRAFKRWSGSTPTAFRQDRRASLPPRQESPSP
ncbi:MAG: helix-turn-helix domain-containing protein [Acidobacteria bacterium]|nr:MAG: helix-turn-helix domain-containing protein [Acidobacteriota bacterium]REK09540.1 MAG: helix-turn-helix domain-containing protein [Acidobacteriota bacterium]